METLDLHGIRHHQVIRKVEEFVLCNDVPLRIITGNSLIMRSLVREVLDGHGLCGEPESDWNLGSLIIREVPP
jgi:hypothetical protein